MADPLIAVVGSVDLSRPGLKKPEHAQQAVLEVGRALAEGGCRILVYSSDEQFVDRGVVAGYVAALSGRSAPLEERIVVLYPADDGEPQFPEQISNRALFSFRADRNPSWDASFYRSLSQLDGLILVGGGYTTFIAGTVALSHQKPIVAIGTFGGKAHELWKELKPEPDILDQTEIDQMAGPWGPDTAKQLIRNLLAQRTRLQARHRDLLDDERRRRAKYHILPAVVMLVAAFAPVPFTWDNSDLQRSFLISLLLVSPLLSGASGATTRTAFEFFTNPIARDPPPLLSACGLGAVAGFIAGALFITAQLVAMSPEIVDQVWSKQAGRLVPFAALVGFIGGLTLDAVFRKLSGTDVVSMEALRALLNAPAPGAPSRP